MLLVQNFVVGIQRAELLFPREAPGTVSHLGIQQSQPLVFPPGGGDRHGPPYRSHPTAYLQVSPQQGARHGVFLRVRTPGHTVQQTLWSHQITERVSYSRYRQVKKKRRDHEQIQGTDTYGVVFHPGEVDKILPRPRPEMTVDRTWKGVTKEGTASTHTHV